MNYTETLEFIHGIARFGSKLGLERICGLLERMGNPQKQLKFVHVAGTNGKGSTCAMLSHILTRAGYRTGLYISPFVLEFRERIQVDGGMIPEEELVTSANRVKPHWDEMDRLGETPSEFEVVVAMAFDYFLRAGCDLVVLEVGMGGRLDATNAIDTPLCSVITSIGIDHTEYLGDTIEKIAAEKCGIIKPGGVTVTYPRQERDALAVIMEHCARMDNRLVMGNAAEILEQSMEGSRIRYSGIEVTVPLMGEHQVWNAVTVLEVVKVLCLSGYGIPDEAVREGIAATRFPSRMEILCRDPLVILDGAHNLSGAKALRQGLELLGNRKIHGVMGILADKDVEGYLETILPRCASVLCVTPDSPRGMQGEDLARLARAHCPNATAAADGESAVRQGLARCQGDDVLLLCGSLYLASQLRPILLRAVGYSNIDAE